MPVTSGDLQTVAAAKFAQALVNGTAMSMPTTFKFSEGGWELSGSDRVPRTPDDQHTDVDAIQNPGSYPPDSQYVFTGSFGPGDITFEAPGICRCRCFLDFGDANDDGFGNNPEFYEIGVFDAGGTMLAWVTFPLESKNPGKQLEHNVRISFGGS